MCIVSMVTDGWGNPIPGDYYPKVPQPVLPQIWDYQLTNPVYEWTIKTCEAFIHLIECALAFDELNNEKNCSDPEKTKILQTVKLRLENLGVSCAAIQRRQIIELLARIDEISEKL